MMSLSLVSLRDKFWWAERGQDEVVGFRKCMAGCIESFDTIFRSKHTSAKNNYCSHICDHDSLLHYILSAGGGDVYKTVSHDMAPSFRLPRKMET